MPSKKSDTATRFCKICHRKIEKNSFHELVFTANSICLRCFYELTPSYIRFVDHGVKVLALYPYEQTFQSLLYLYKGCGDIELSSAFLERVRLYLKLRYAGYFLVPAPSHPSHIAKRGFDHVPLIFESLGKKIVPLIEKTEEVKQADLTKEQRQNVASHLRLTHKPDLTGKKVLFVDDVYTTGATMRACVSLIRSLKPKHVEALVLSHVSKRK